MHHCDKIDWKHGNRVQLQAKLDNGARVCHSIVARKAKRGRDGGGECNGSCRDGCHNVKSCAIARTQDHLRIARAAVPCPVIQVQLFPGGYISGAHQNHIRTLLLKLHVSTARSWRWLVGQSHVHLHGKGPGRSRTWFVRKLPFVVRGIKKHAFFRLVHVILGPWSPFALLHHLLWCPSSSWISSQRRALRDVFLGEETSPMQFRRLDFDQRWHGASPRPCIHRHGNESGDGACRSFDHQRLGVVPRHPFRPGTHRPCAAPSSPSLPSNASHPRPLFPSTIAAPAPPVAHPSAPSCFLPRGFHVVSVPTRPPSTRPWSRPTPPDP